MKATELVMRATQTASLDGNMDELAASAVIACLTNDAKRIKEAVAAIKMRVKTGHGKSRVLAVQLADRCMRACGSAFHAAVAASLLDRLVKIGLEARSQDAATSQLQWECCRCVQSWGTELLPRLGQYVEATRRVAARNAAAARMTQHVEQHWPRSSRHADEMSSVGSLSSVSTATSSASVNTMSSSSSSKSSSGGFGGAAVAIRAVDSVFEDPDLDFLDAPSPVIPRHTPISPPAWGGGGFVGAGVGTAAFVPMGQRAFPPNQNIQPQPFAPQRPGSSRPSQAHAAYQPFDSQRPRSAQGPAAAHSGPMPSFASVAAQLPRERRVSGEAAMYLSSDAHPQHNVHPQESRPRRLSNESAANISPEDRRHAQHRQHRPNFSVGPTTSGQQMDTRARRMSNEGANEQRGRGGGPAPVRGQHAQSPPDAPSTSGTWL